MVDWNLFNGTLPYGLKIHTYESVHKFDTTSHMQRIEIGCSQGRKAELS